METLKWKFTKSKRTGRYILYHPARHKIKIVDTREEAMRLRKELNIYRFQLK